MTRINHVEKARKSPGSCSRCSAVIPNGSGYYWIAFFRSPKRIRCEKPECRFRKSDTTQSKLSTVYAAQEAAEEALKAWDRKDHEALQEIVTSCGGTVREVYDEYEDAANEHPNLASQTEEVRSSLDSIASNLESFSVDEWDKDAETQEAWAERVFDEAEDAIAGVSEV